MKKIKNREELQNLITSYLEKRKASPCGSYPEVSKEEMADLSRIIYGLLSLKYEEDLDGWLPVEYILVNRTTERTISPWPHIRHTHGLVSDDETREALLQNLYTSAVQIGAWSKEIEIAHKQLKRNLEE